MGSKQFARRYWLVGLLFVLLAVVGTVLYRPSGNPTDAAATPPAQVIMQQAVVVDQGVQLAWLEAQSRTNPIVGYAVERSRGDSEYERIARVEPAFFEYLDTDGQPGDLYRIVAEDSRGERSPASEYAVAETPRPGSVVVTTPSPSRVLGAATALKRATAPGQKAAALQDLIAQSFAGIDAALNSKDHTAARNLLQTLQDYQRQALSLWPQLTPAQKVPLAQSCLDNMDVFEANLHILPEDDQFDGMLVVAGCDALQEGAE